jgi:CRP-like cAMP-binding protein
MVAGLTDEAISVGSAALEHRNAILSALPREELARIMPLFRTVQLRPRQILHHAGTPMEQAYFLESGLVSVSGRAGAHGWVEVWLIGSEGMTGIPIVLGTMQEPALRRVVQIGGHALCIPAADLRKAMERSPAFRAVLMRYVDVVLLQTAQCNICNATHNLRQRLSRWLLVARDALQQDEIRLTHQLLSRLLGVRRASVTECLGVLQAEGAIRSSRGLIEIADPPKLEELSCGCHRTILHHHDTQLGPRDREWTRPGRAADAAG